MYSRLTTKSKKHKYIKTLYYYILYDIYLYIYVCVCLHHYAYTSNQTHDHFEQLNIFKCTYTLYTLFYRRAKHIYTVKPP